MLYILRIHHPDRCLGLMGTVTNPDCGELAQVNIFSLFSEIFKIHSPQISYSSAPGQQTLAAGFSNNTVKIWTRAN